MAITTDEVTVGTSPTSLGAPGRHDPDGITVYVQNPDGNGDIFVGGPDVTAADGIRLVAGADLSVELPRSAELFGIATSAQDVRRLVIA